MTVKTHVFTITDEPSRIDNAGIDEGHNGESFAVQNDGAQTAYIGGPDVTANDDADTGGFKRAAGSEIGVDLEAQEALYAVCATGLTTTLRTFETGV